MTQQEEIKKKRGGEERGTFSLLLLFHSSHCARQERGGSQRERERDATIHLQIGSFFLLPPSLPPSSPLPLPLPLWRKEGENCRQFSTTSTFPGCSSGEGGKERKRERERGRKEGTLSLSLSLSLSTLSLPLSFIASTQWALFSLSLSPLSSSPPSLSFFPLSCPGRKDSYSPFFSEDNLAAAAAAVAAAAIDCCWLLFLGQILDNLLCPSCLAS